MANGQASRRNQQSQRAQRSQQTQRGQNPPRQQQSRGRPPQRRRRKKYTLHYFILFLFCLGVGLALCFTVLFKVNSIKVEGNSYYSSEELISRSGIQKEQGLFDFSASDIEKMLEDRFPYIQDVQIKRRLPTTVVIKVKEEEPVGAAYTEDGYVVISRTGKVLKTKVNAPPGDVPVILGMEDEVFTVGSYLDEVQTVNGQKTRVLIEKMQKLQNFLDVTESMAFGDLTYISISDNGEIEVLYDGRILIDFGGEIDLSKKIAFVQKVLADGIAENHPLSGYTNDNFEGTIDITDRKQLRTRAIAVNSIRDERAFTVFEDDEAFFAEDEETEELPEEELPEDEIPEENASETGESGENGASTENQQ